MSASSSNLVVGFTTQEFLLVDLDNCSKFKAERIARLIHNEYPEAGSVLGVESSPNHYHLVFGGTLLWERIVYIIKVLYELGIVEKNYAQIRTFRRDLTLRVSPKYGADHFRPVPNPRFIIYSKLGPEYDVGIEQYLETLDAFIDELVR